MTESKYNVILNEVKNLMPSVSPEILRFAQDDRRRLYDGKGRIRMTGVSGNYNTKSNL
jgi:hypothetical protein